MPGGWPLVPHVISAATNHSPSLGSHTPTFLKHMPPHAHRPAARDAGSQVMGLTLPSHGPHICPPWTSTGSPAPLPTPFKENLARHKRPPHCHPSYLPPSLPLPQSLSSIQRPASSPAQRLEWPWGTPRKRQTMGQQGTVSAHEGTRARCFPEELHRKALPWPGPPGLPRLLAPRGKWKQRRPLMGKTEEAGGKRPAP